MIRTSRGVPCDGENYFERNDSYTDEIDTRLADCNTVTDGVLGLDFLAHPETRWRLVVCNTTSDVQIARVLCVVAFTVDGASSDVLRYTCVYPWPLAHFLCVHLFITQELSSRLLGHCIWVLVLPVYGSLIYQCMRMEDPTGAKSRVDTDGKRRVVVPGKHVVLGSFSHQN
jgi:hypothetical protein